MGSNRAKYGVIHRGFNLGAGGQLMCVLTMVINAFRCLGGFSVMWVTKLLISPVKKRIFCPKTTKFGPKLAFLVNLGQAMQAYSVPCWWVGWWLWPAGCISQDTYLLYNSHYHD